MKIMVNDEENKRRVIDELTRDFSAVSDVNNSKDIKDTILYHLLNCIAIQTA